VRYRIWSEAGKNKNGRLKADRFYSYGVPKGIQQKGKKSYLIEIQFELKTAA
jgi:hypothetical protein